MGHGHMVKKAYQGHGQEERHTPAVMIAALARERIFAHGSDKGRRKTWKACHGIARYQAGGACDKLIFDPLAKGCGEGELRLGIQRRKGPGCQQRDVNQRFTSLVVCNGR